MQARLRCCCGEHAGQCQIGHVRPKNRSGVAVVHTDNGIPLHHDRARRCDGRIDVPVAGPVEWEAAFDVLEDELNWERQQAA